MKLVYLTIVLLAASLFAISEVDAHKKHKHGGHGHHDHHVHHHHYYHSDHGHGWNNRYKREVVVDVVKPEESMGTLLDKLMVNAKLDHGKTLDLPSVSEVKPLNGAVADDIAKETAKVVKVDEKVQNVASFAL